MLATEDDWGPCRACDILSKTVLPASSKPLTGKSALQRVKEVAATASTERIGKGKKGGKPPTDKPNPSKSIVAAKQALKEMAHHGEYGRVTWESRLRGPVGANTTVKASWVPQSTCFEWKTTLFGILSKIELTTKNLFDSHRRTMGLEKFKIAEENAFQYSVHCERLKTKVSLPFEEYEFRHWRDLFDHLKEDFSERDIAQGHLQLSVQIQLDYDMPEVEDDEEDANLALPPSIRTPHTRSKTTKRKELAPIGASNGSILPLPKKQRSQPVQSALSQMTSKVSSIDRERPTASVPSRSLSTASRLSRVSGTTSSLFRPSSVFTPLQRRVFGPCTLKSFSFQPGSDGMLEMCSNLREKQRVTVSVANPPLEGAFKRCLDGEYEGQMIAIVFCPQRTVPATPIIPEEAERVAGEVENECRPLALTDAVVKQYMKTIRSNSSPSTLPGIKVNAGDSVFVVDFGAVVEIEIRKEKHKFYQHAILSPRLANWPKAFIKFSDASGRFQPWNPESGMTEDEWETTSKMLAALTHFSWVSSGESYVPVDLQGAWDREQKQFTLSDVQLHTTTTFSDRNLSHWDHKEAGIAAFFDTHQECNVFCHVVGVVGKVFERRHKRLAISSLVH